VITRPGEGAFLPKGEVKGYRITEESWMLEYGLGPVPTALPMGLGDAVFRGQDPHTIVKTLWAYGKLAMKELVQRKI